MNAITEFAKGYKKIRMAYVALVIAFYISIPVTFEADAIAILLHGYGFDIAFDLFDRADYAMVGHRYQAYSDSFWLARDLAVTGMAIWISAFFSSMWALFMRIKKKVTLAPYILDYVTLFVSSIMLVILVLLLIPPVIYGMG